MSAPETIVEPPVTYMAGATAPTLGKKLRSGLNSSPFYMLIILLVVVAFFSYMSPNFATKFNVRNVFLDASTLMILAIGMTYVMISGGFDLSIGSAPTTPAPSPSACWRPCSVGSPGVCSTASASRACGSRR